MGRTGANCGKLEQTGDSFRLLSENRTDVLYNNIVSDSGHGFNRIRARCCMRVPCPCTPNMRRKSRLLRRQSECASFLPLKILFSRFAFSSRCHQPLRETGKAADRRVSQIVVAQHIAATCDLQTAVPRADFLGGIRNRKICPHILDCCGL